ncbi:MAG: caspase family protein [Candidatus Heimdallarchaeum aukensis]|uniref:Caspase family protein n=1 Tax=Candidatus Heimdallarchaeum aukensis TaxID=2876573 RepID=A0A9Y1BLK0_9ARCH|nr:MAG: caspase family protein [Candidatus Heimdallarchaeum aukensis]
MSNNKHTTIALIIVILSLALVFIKPTGAGWVEWEGKVYNEWNNGVSGAIVKLKQNNVVVKTTTTDSNGEYSLIYYTSSYATYKITVTKEDYNSQTKTVPKTSLGEPWVVDFNIRYVMKYAVIVGIEDYAYLNDLQYTENDADAWYDFLCDTSLDFDEVDLYKGSNAYESAIKNALENMVNIADKGDIIAFIFSGHGYKKSSTEHALSMWDADGNGNTGYLYDSELATILTSSEAERIFLFFDCCYSYGMQEELAEIGSKDHILLTSSCDKNEISYYDKANEKSCWTQSFLVESWINNNEPEDPVIDVFNDAIIYFRAHITNGDDYYSTDQNPQLWNPYGNNFRLTKYGISPP